MCIYELEVQPYISPRGALCAMSPQGALCAMSPQGALCALSPQGALYAMSLVPIYAACACSFPETGQLLPERHHHGCCDLQAGCRRTRVDMDKMVR